MRRLTEYLPRAVLALSLLALSGLALRAAWVPDAGAQTLGGAATARADIKNTRHNLGQGAPSRYFTAGNTGGTAPASPELVPQGATGEICVFCHTPHNALQAPGQPLWNRLLPGAAATATTYAVTYTGYTSSTLNAGDLNVTDAVLGQSSKLCLSCHDGMLGLGTLANAPGPGGAGSTAVANTAAGDTMPFGRGQGDALHGFTRRLGTDLRNDHPISFTYNTALATADGELRLPSATPPVAEGGSAVAIANRANNPRGNPAFPLESGRVQCSTCHEPHRNTQKFLRKNRLVQGSPQPPAQTVWDNWNFSDASDQICMGCHTRLGLAWQRSAHADYTAGNETYTADGAKMRDFPETPATAVWQAGCLNCHDTHTVSGSRYLLREGVNSSVVTISGSLGYTSAQLRAGVAVGTTTNLNTASAQENTCFQCHSSTPVINPVTLTGANTVPSNSEGVPNIAAEFGRTYRMPITNADQGLPTGTGNAFEVHEVTDREGTESPANLGKGVPPGLAGPPSTAWYNRHVECSDCHNPHRVLKANNFLGAAAVVTGFTADATRRTHTPSAGTGGQYGNIAGGPLRGAWGVEPVYSGVTATSIWMSAAEEPSFVGQVKKGDPGGATTFPVGKPGSELATWVTREYQICFKCHSGYAIGSDPPTANEFPTLKAAGRGGTPTTLSNGMQRYTNVAREFAVKATDTGLASGGASSGVNAGGYHQGEFTNDGTSYGGAGTGACGGNDCNPIIDGGSAGAGTNGVNHRSWHPVIFPTGRNRAERQMGNTGAINLRAPWEANIGRQTMQCSDCHGQSNSWSAPATPGAGAPNLALVQGPHGSDSPFLLKGTWSTATTLSQAATGGATWEGHLCGKCHQPRNGLSGYANNHNMGRDAMLTTKCMTCHMAVPHGWRNKAFLVNMNCVGIESSHASHPVGNNCTNYSGGAPGAGTSYTGQVIAPYYNGAGLRIGTWPRSGSWVDTNCNGGMTSCTTG